MVNMPEKVIESIKATKTVVFATVDNDCTPNAVPNQFFIVKDPETILVGDNFWKKTADNVKKPDSKVSIACWADPKEGYQVKGYGNYVTEGPEFEMMKTHIKSRSEKLPAKGCFVMKVTAVYDLAITSPGTQIA